MDKVKYAFTYSGRINRIEFLLLGLIVPVILIFIGVIISSINTLADTIGVILLFAGLSMYISSTIKRSRDMKFNTSIGILLSLFISTVGIIVLLLTPSYIGDDKPKSGKSIIIIGILFVLLVLGILAAVSIPKLSQINEQVLQANKKMAEQKQLQEHTKNQN